MEDCNSVYTPMETRCKLSKDDVSPIVDQTFYRSIVGSLLFVTATRPDISKLMIMLYTFKHTKIKLMFQTHFHWCQRGSMLSQEVLCSGSEASFSMSCRQRKIGGECWSFSLLNLVYRLLWMVAILFEVFSHLTHVLLIWDGSSISSIVLTNCL